MGQAFDCKNVAGSYAGECFKMLSTIPDTTHLKENARHFGKDSMA